jgi:hypothetical protein
MNTINIMNIKEQIDHLPLDLFTRQRIMELTIKAQSYDMLNCTAEFNLPQAFAWVQTSEGGDYWLKVFIELERIKYEKEQKRIQESKN